MLTKEEIVRRLDEGPLQERLVITPLLDRTLQISGISVDLRLGFDFILPRRANIAAIDSMSPSSELLSKRFNERVTLIRGKELRLVPGEFVLGASLEYIALPADLAAHVTSRSSWGRAGLVIATAISVAPGFKGVITLELANLGVVPLVLRPGVRIAQIVFTRTNATESYSGRYSCPTHPEFGKVHLDKDLPFWGKPEVTGPP